MAEESGVQGGCLCGAVRYRAVGNVKSQSICHCSNCRRATGAQSVAWVTVLALGFSIEKGEVDRFRSDTGATWSFCGQCGTTLTYENKNRPEVDITVGSLDDPEAFPPNVEGSLDEKLLWVHRIEAQ